MDSTDNTIRISSRTLLLVGFVVAIIVIIVVMHLKSQPTTVVVTSNNTQTQTTQKLIPATREGNNVYCNGKKTDPSVTACIPNGGAYFGSSPQALNAKGQDVTTP